MIYRREIDGLRAIAVLPVIFFHAGFESLSGGFVGVDVFYVISGYLITQILLKELREGRFSVVNFYERRARRILPSLFVVLVACIPFAYLWMLPAEFAGFWASVVAVVTFTANIHFWRSINYFSPSADNELLLHAWSLAVEEQFYLLFPIYLLLMWRYSRSRLVVVTATAALASFMIAEWGWRSAPVANFYLLPGRMWELLAGALIAFWHEKRSREEIGKFRFFSEVVPAVGLIAILWSMVVLKGSTATPAYLMAVPVLGTCAIIAAANGKDVTSRLLSMRPLVFIGLISYSAYLWHQPMFALLRMRNFGEVVATQWLLAIAACLVLSALTWRFVELPFRARSGGAPLFSTRTVFTSSILGLSSFAVAGYAALQSPRTIDAFTHVSLSGGCYRASSVSDCPQGPAAIDVVLWGDSIAEAFTPALMKAGAVAGVAVHPRIFHSCPSLLGVARNESYRNGPRFAMRCAAYTEDVKTELESLRPDVVVLASAYQYYRDGVNPIDDQPILLGDGDDIVLDSFERTIRFLHEIGAQVIVVAPYPVLENFNEARRQALLGVGDGTFSVNPNASRELTRLIEERSQGVATVVSIDDLFCVGNACSVIDDAGNHLTFDGSHLSQKAADQLAVRIFEKVSLP